MVNAIGDSMSSTTTGFDGTFRLTDLAPGQMMLNAMKADEFIQVIRPVTAPATDVNIEVPPGGRISGRVVDKATGAPVTAFQAGVSAPRGGGGMVIMMPPSMRPFTSDDGTFVLENVPVGQTQVVVNAAGYTTGRVSNLTVEEGKTLANVEVAMDTGVKLSGHVTGPDGSALGGVSVRQDMVSGRTMRIPGGADALGDDRRERRLHHRSGRAGREDVRLPARRLPAAAEVGHPLRQGRAARRADAPPVRASPESSSPKRVCRLAMRASARTRRRKAGSAANRRVPIRRAPSRSKGCRPATTPSPPARTVMPTAFCATSTSWPAVRRA